MAPKAKPAAPIERRPTSSLRKKSRKHEMSPSWKRHRGDLDRRGFTPAWAEEDSHEGE